MKVIGLAGPPGSGKSAVGRALSKRAGVEWIDLDPIAWSVYREGTEVFVELIDRFGSGICGDTGEIDRTRLAKAAFSSPEARRDLDSIVHPAVNEAIAERTREEAAAGTAVLMIEGALLATSPHVDRDLFDAILWLEVSDDVRRQRLASDDREAQADRLRDMAPSDGVLRVSADGTVLDVAERVARAIGDL